MTIASPDFTPMQQRLKGIGLYNAPIDGEWGPAMNAGISELILRAEVDRGIKTPAWPNLSSSYAWLRNVGGVPRHLDEALKLYGTLETAGPGNNPVIMGWRDELNAAGVKIEGYTADSVPWCGLFMAVIMLRARRAVVAQPLWALNWGKFGEDGGQPELGDVLTFQREGGGHVGLYIAEDAQGYYHVLGGNTSDAVKIARIAKVRMKACRQPPYVTRPASVRPYVVAASGAISTNEA